jgi:uncharacterized coiled-coil DUF342 family protein
MEVHPNEVIYLKKKVDGMLSLMVKMEARINELVDTVESQSSTIRDLERLLAVSGEDEPPARKRKTPQENKPRTPTIKTSKSE